MHELLAHLPFVMEKECDGRGLKSITEENLEAKHKVKFKN